MRPAPTARRSTVVLETSAFLPASARAAGRTSATCAHSYALYRPSHANTPSRLGFVNFGQRVPRRRAVLPGVTAAHRSVAEAAPQSLGERRAPGPGGGKPGGRPGAAVEHR